jgi:DNA-directed RNA polymerase specialized sigma subunit
MSNEYLNNKVFEGIINRFQTSKRNKAKYELILEDLRDAYERKEVRKSNRKQDRLFLEENQHAQEVVITEYVDSQKHLAVAFYTLSDNIVKYAKFSLIDADDAVQEGVMICFEKIDRFNPKKGKAFNYMTTCILNHFRQLYRTARNYNELKRKYHDFSQLMQNSNGKSGGSL